MYINILFIVSNDCDNSNDSNELAKSDNCDLELILEKFKNKVKLILRKMCYMNKNNIFEIKHEDINIGNR